MYISGFFLFVHIVCPVTYRYCHFIRLTTIKMKQKQLNNQIHYINLLYICKQQMTLGTGNRNNIEIFLYSWRALYSDNTKLPTIPTIFLNQLIQFYPNNATNLQHLTTHSMTVLHHKMAIVFWPQICDVDSPYVYQLQQFYLKCKYICHNHKHSKWWELHLCLSKPWDNVVK